MTSKIIGDGAPHLHNDYPTPGTDPLVDMKRAAKALEAWMHPALFDRLNAAIDAAGETRNKP